MRLYPTKTAVHLALAGAVVTGVGLVAGQGAIVAWGVAVVLGVALARAGTLVSVARIRAAGFEMLWTTPVRKVRISRGHDVILDAEVRNRDTRAARYVSLRPLASSMLTVTLDPASGEVPASGALKVSVRVRGDRVGRHGIFGLSLEVQGAPGLFEVPLTFGNPFGIEVMPGPYAAGLASPRGGRSRVGAEEGRAGKWRGEGTDLRELREYHPGDPFRRIAWRASARRGKLVVREMERDERDVVWIVLDASVELWSGMPGTAPLDGAIDDVAGLVDRHVAKGDLVGLAIVATRVLARIEPARGVAHAAKLHEALAHATGVHDADRSDLDEADVGLRVHEHLRPLDARGLADVSRRDLDKLAQRAIAAEQKSPFAGGPIPFATTARERVLRGYLASFGLESPPRMTPERPATEATLVRILSGFSKGKKRPSVVYVVSSAQESTEGALADALRDLGRGGSVRWLGPSLEPSLESVVDEREETGLVVRAMLARVRLSRARGEKSLRRLGVKLERVRRLAPRKPLASGDP